MERQGNILIVDDNTPDALRLAQIAGDLGFAVFEAGDAPAAESELRFRCFEFALVDVHLTEGACRAEGLTLVQHIRREHPRVAIVALSSDQSTDLYERAMQAGADHFVRKPLAKADDLAIVLDLALTRHQLELLAKRGHTPALPESLTCHCPHGLVIAPGTLRLAERAARSGKVPVSIMGETGTGKEEIAKLVHQLREGREQRQVPLVIVNCANLSETLMESTIFGHKKGSFSGATETTLGCIGEADGGILFLDEIHTLTRICQQKLLRVLNDGSYQRLGDPTQRRSEFQVIVASTRDLEGEVENEHLLLDLYSRLIGIDIRLKPLRERLDEMPLFAAVFFAKKQVNVEPQEFEGIVERCRRYYWRGNVRQLYQVLSLLLLSSDESGAGVKAENLPETRLMFAPDHRSEAADMGAAAGYALPGDMLTRDRAPPTAAGTARVALEDWEFLRRCLGDDRPLSESVDAFERLVIKYGVARHHGRVARVSDALGVPRTSLYAKIRRYQLKPDDTATELTTAYRTTGR